MTSPVEITREGTLGRITLSRPDRRNPLDSEMAAAIHDGLVTHFEDDAVRSVVLDAKGQAFCAGADLEQVKTLPTMSARQAFEWPAPIIAAQQLMLDAPKPVMAAVQGPAYAGGLGLAAMCDIVLATRAARFATPEVKIGLFPMIIVPQLVRAIPRKMLMELMLTGDPMTAEDAHRLGFVNALAEDRDGLEELVASYAAKFEKVSPDAVRMGRRAFAVMSELPMADALGAAQMFNVAFFLGPDFADGSRAFLEKRPPRWVEEPE
jgi:enoyl-CoA hydratase/carnithine racemase